MIAISGRIPGARLVSFDTSAERLVDSYGRSQWNLSRLVIPDAHGDFAIELPDNQELSDPNGQRWVWLVCEQTFFGTFRFDISSDAAVLDYAKVRPVR